MAFLNQFSFLLLAAGMLLGLILILLRRSHADGDLITVLALVVGLAFAYVFFRPFDSGSQAAESIQANITDGQPVLLEFQSPYCIACMAVEPTVKKVETDYEGVLEVVRINVLEAGFEPLMKRYQFQYTPTFVFLDPQGEEIWRMVGTLDPERVRSTLKGIR